MITYFNVAQDVEVLYFGVDMTYIFNVNNELQWLNDHRFIWDYYHDDIPDGKPYVFCKTNNWSIALTRIKGELFFEAYHTPTWKRIDVNAEYDYSSINLLDVLEYIQSISGEEEFLYY